MKFVFVDKSKIEMNIITDILAEEKIAYKIKKNIARHFFFDEDDDDADDDDGCCIIEELYDIFCFTDLEHFEFIKHLVNKKWKDRVHLERSYLKVRRKNVQRVSKKNITNTDNKHGGK